MCDVIEERDELEMMEREMPVPFRMEPAMDSFVGIMKTFCPARFISGDVVYHYTKSGVFEKLMEENGDILCSQYTDLNDDGEWDLGVDYISEYISNHNRTEIRDSFEGLVRDIHNRNPPFIASFSAHEDKASMWGMYTDRKEGGYAVGIGREDLEQLCKVNNQNNKVYELYFLPCVYLGVDDVDAIVERMIRNQADEIECTARHTIFEVGELLARRLLFLSYLIKHGSFDYENEWRMVLCPVASGFKQKIKKFKTEEGSVKRGIFSGVFGSDNPIWKSFRRVEVSPHGNVTALYGKAKGYREQRNLGFDLDLSGSTYNGR